MQLILHHITNALQVGVKSPTMAVKRIHHNFSPDFVSAGISVQAFHTFSISLPYMFVRPTTNAHQACQTYNQTYHTMLIKSTILCPLGIANSAHQAYQTVLFSLSYRQVYHMYSCNQVYYTVLVRPTIHAHQALPFGLPYPARQAYHKCSLGLPHTVIVRPTMPASRTTIECSIGLFYSSQ